MMVGCFYGSSKFCLSSKSCRYLLESSCQQLQSALAWGELWDLSRKVKTRFVLWLSIDKIIGKVSIERILTVGYSAHVLQNRPSLVYPQASIL
jgi:hypothetical protein